MEQPIITFEEIIKLNDDWDRAYAVLNYTLDRDNLKKEVVESGQVIYYNPTRLQINNLIHDNIFADSSHIGVALMAGR